MTTGFDAERLRRLFARPDDPGPARGDCPADERIWAARNGELPPDEVQALLDHSLECAACAESWRLAAALAEAAEGDADAEPAASGRRGLRSWPVLLAAAVAVLAIGLGVVLRQPGVPDAEYRDSEAGTIVSRIDEDARLDRQRCTLAWSAGPPGTLYSLEVVGQDLTPLFAADEVERSEYVVPASAFEGLEPGTRFFWRVEALHPDLTRVRSPVFRAVIE